MTTTQAVNLNHLCWQFLERDPGMLAAARHLDKAVVDDKHLRLLLNINTEPELNNEDRHLRGEINGLLRAYSLLEVASIAGFVPAAFPKDLAQRILRHLEIPALRVYYEVDVPLLLPQMQRIRLTGEQGVSDERKAGSLTTFTSYLDLTSSVETDSDIRVFWYLLETSLDGISSATLLNAMTDPEQYLEHLFAPIESLTPLEQGLIGFLKAIEFAHEFRSFLDNCKRQSLLQSAMWHSYAHWFDVVVTGGKLGEFVDGATDRFAKWPIEELTGLNTVVAKRSLLRIQRDLHQLSSNKYGIQLKRELGKQLSHQSPTRVERPVPVHAPARVKPLPAPRALAHVLREPWPAFLDSLEWDLEAAKRDFAVFAYRVLETRPPAILRNQTKEEREDWIQEIILHFTSGDGRVLREYRNTGHPFSAWFITRVNHKAYDFYRKAGTYRDRTASIDDKPAVIGHPDPSDPADIRAEFSEVIVKVTACIRKMSRKCQILLQAAADEYNPREMLTLLGTDAGTNKQAADDLRACRKRLRALLEQEGVEISRFLK